MYGHPPRGGPRRPPPPRLQGPNFYYAPPPLVQTPNNYCYFSPPPPLQPPNYYSPPPRPNPNLLLQNASFSTHLPPPPPRPNPNLLLQNPSFSTHPPPPPPNQQQHPQISPPLQRINQAISKAHRDLLDSGETVSALKVSNSALLALQADSWDSLGIKIERNPLLHKLMVLEGKVNAFINCFVEVRRITSLHELQVEICMNECVQQFEELELGPLLRHPLVVHYFEVPSDANEIIKITSAQIISYLVQLMVSQGRSKTIKIDEFLDFIAVKRSLPVEDKAKLGIRIHTLRMHVKSIRLARLAEINTLRKYLRSMRKKPIDGEDDDDDIEDEDDENDSVLSSQRKISPQNKNISDRRVGGQSSLDSDRVMIGENKRSSAKKRKRENPSLDYPLKLPKRDKAKLSVHDLELLKDSDGGKSHGTKSRPQFNVVVDKVIFFKRTMHFIKIWKETCRLQPPTEVMKMMHHFYKLRKKSMTLALFHVAVTSIKFGMWDSLYNSFQSIGEREYITSTSTPTEPENISAEPSSVRDALPIKEQSSRLNHGITIDDISKQVCTYFDLTRALPVEGKSALEKQFIFLRKLHGCQIWVTAQFSVKEFGYLGFGEFYRFLEEHPFLIPNELLESLFEKESKKSVFEVSMLQYQLVILLSQAASFLWENDSVTKEQVYKLLKKQFPVISFQVSDDGPFGDLSELLKKHQNADSSTSVLFSVTLLGNDYVRGSLVHNNIHLSEEIIPKPDIGMISGALGSVSSKDAIQCLLKAPMLSDLQSWSHWDLIYAPSLGPLVEWLLNEVYMRELLCLVTKDGKIIRIDHSATMNEFLEAFKVSAYEAAVKLLSLFSLYGGQRKVPLALLKRHAQSGIEIILNSSMDCLTVENNCNTYMHDGKALKGQYALDRESIVEQPLLNFSVGNVASFNLNDQHRINKAVSVASRFILDCLCYLPSEFRSFAADVLLSGLQSSMKDAPLAVLRECSQAHQLHMLHAIGLSLNVCDWIADYRSFSSGTANNLSMSVGASSRVVASPTYCLNSKFKDDALEDLSISVDKLVGAESDEHNEVLGEVHEKKVNKVSTEKIGGGRKRILQNCVENEDETVIVESIRREEFGLVSSLTEADNIMLKKQHTRLGRALQCLSQELYSRDSHFVLELVQNADDNYYPEKVEPTLVFILQSTGLVVLNNEQGFTAQNIRALCDVGRSTKKGSNAGYIGHKGLGFKSVFRVTDCPEIHSNGFHVKFDISEGQIGFVLPTVVSPCDIVSLRRLLPHEANETDTCWNTCIVLPFKPKLRDRMGLSTTVSVFSDLHPSLLLFLHRLQCIKFKNMLNDTFTVMKREILEDGIVKISHGKEIMNWFVATQTLQASVIRPDVQTTKIAVAFTLGESSDGEYKAHLEQQPVFAFLPLRTYGLKFILQGDFVLPSSREEVDTDSAWNQWLLSEFPGLFVSAQRSLCDLRCFRERPGRAVAAYMSFVPLVGEVHGFFSQLPRMIISKLRVSNCLVVEGQEEWVLPSRVLRGWNEQARILLPDNLLHQHLGLGYLDKDIYLSDSLAKALGVSEYGPRILIEIISSICRTDEGIKSLGLDWLSSWLSVLYLMLVHSSGHASVNAWIEADLSEMLRNTPFIPLSDGTFGSIAEGTIWLRCDAVNCGFEGEHESEAFPSLYAILRIVSPAILSAEVTNTHQLEELTVDNVTKILLKIGVQRLSAHEVIRRHILPALSDDSTAERDRNLMTEYLSFVMLHLQSNCPHCHTEKEIIISQLLSKAFILTNHGYRRPGEVPIHFSREFGNPVDVTKLIDVMNSDWHEVDITYLKHSSNKSVSFGLIKWRDFFQELGITDFVQTVQVEKNIAEVSHTFLNDLMCNVDLLKSGFVFIDWESPELVNLLSTLSSQNNQEKSIYLLGVLDTMWDDCFSEKVRGCCIDGSNEDGKLFKSSFIKSINDFQWMASSINQKLCYPKDLFYDCEGVRSILGNFAPYAVPQVRSKTFLSDLGLKTCVTIDDALEILQVLRSIKATVTVSIDQMSKFYAFIWGEMATAKVEIARVFSSGPYIFIPFANDARQGDVLSGKLFSSDEVYWHDPTGSMDLLKETLLQCGSLYETNYPVKMMLAHVYQGLHDFFVNECKVCEIPPPRSYIRILVQLSKVALPSQAANTVLRVLLKWADDLKSGLLKLEDVVYLKECLVKLETAVLPTQQNKWVSLHPTFGLVFWCDNRALQKQFKHFDNINALYFGELKLHEQKVLPGKILGLMQALGIPSLSEIVAREAIFYNMVDGTQKALLVDWVLPYAQRYIYKFHPDKYVQLKQSGFGNIWSLQVVVVEKLFFRHTINGCDNASNKPTECSCLLQDNNLYVDQSSNLHPMLMELSRLFFYGTPELHLANFLWMITTMSESGAMEEQMEFFVVDSQKIPKLPDEEAVWFLSSLLPRQASDENTQPTMDRRLLKGKRKRGIIPSCPPADKVKRKQGIIPSCPLADWRITSDFSLAQENQFRNKFTAPSQDNDKIEGITCTEDYQVPVGTDIDWVIENGSVETTTSLVLQDLGAWGDKPLLRGSALTFGRATSSSEKLSKAVSVTIDSENSDRAHFNESQAAITGRMGELVAFKHFAKKFGEASVKWVNAETETGLPYDITIGVNEESKEYIEVKATTYAKKDWFGISMPEWQFAIDRGEFFSIAHVVLIGQNNAKIRVFKNPLRLCQQRMLHLAVLMRKSLKDTILISDETQLQ